MVVTYVDDIQATAPAATADSLTHDQVYMFR